MHCAVKGWTSSAHSIYWWESEFFHYNEIVLRWDQLVAETRCHLSWSIYQNSSQRVCYSDKSVFSSKDHDWEKWLQVSYSDTCWILWWSLNCCRLLFLNLSLFIYSHWSISDSVYCVSWYTRSSMSEWVWRHINQISQLSSVSHWNHHLLCKEEASASETSSLHLEECQMISCSVLN